MSCWKFRAIAVVALLSLPSTASARTHFGTVVLDDGQRIEQARYKVKTLFNLVEIVRIGNRKVQRKISFRRIAALIDRNGKDVTRKYLGRFARTRLGRPSDLPETRPDSSSDTPDKLGRNLFRREPAAARRPRARLWNLAIRAGSNLGVPRGSILGEKSVGLGFGVDIVVPVNHFLAVRGTVSRSGLHNPAPDIILSSFSFNGLQGGDNSFTLTRFTLAGQYYFYNQRESYPPSFVGFIYSGLGASVRHRTFGSTSYDASTGELHNRKLTETFSDFLSSTGVGFDAFFDSRFGLEFDLNLNVIFVDSRRYESAGYAYIFDLRLGAVAFF